MKYFIIIFLFSLKLNACDCDIPKPIMEFYNAEYVFEGVVATKVYNEDYESYAIAFRVEKHYKLGENPNVLRFTLASEEFYTDVISSCDWSVAVGEKWLVYAYRKDNGDLRFSYYCSNSKKLDFSNINKSEQLVLENGNNFILENYIYEKEIGFTNPKPITKIDSILTLGKIEAYKNTFTVVKVHVDAKGMLQSVASIKDYSAIKIDKLYNLLYYFSGNTKKTFSSFTDESIRLAKKLKHWEIKYYKKTNTPVAYVKTIIFQYDTKTKKWMYEL